jgi:hypothetical protein
MSTTEFVEEYRDQTGVRPDLSIFNTAAIERWFENNRTQIEARRRQRERDKFRASTQKRPQGLSSIGDFFK